MKELENRLRAAFHADAETVRPETIRYLEGEPMRRAHPAGPKPHRRVLIPLAAAASVAAIAIATSVIAPAILSGQRSSGPTAAGRLATAYPGGRLPAGPPPRYFVGIALLDHRVPAYGTVMSVYSSATGRVVAHFPSPGPGLYYQAVAAVGSTGWFTAAATPGTFPKTARGCGTAINQFRLNSQGQPIFRGVIASPVPGFIGNSSLAVSANGKVISYATRSCGTNTGQLTVTPDTEKSRTWTYKFPVSPESLSLSADGGLLSLVSDPAGGCQCGSPSAETAWVLRPNSAPGPLAQRWRKVLSAPSGVDSAALSPTGAVTFAAVSRVSHGRLGVAVGAYDTGTGRLLRLVRAFTKVQVLPPGIAVDQSGHYALVYMLTDRGVQRLNLTTGQLKVLPVTRADFPIDVAW